MYGLAHEQVQRGCELFKAGRGFRDIGLDGWLLPEPFLAKQQPAIDQGMGLCNDYPLIMNEQWFDSSGFDGEIAAGMMFCIESYVGAPGGNEGVKLE
ncbi:MAG: Xaa-Pro dipeptidase [Gammaproteobacteria bacterium]|jgi:Xaa-Pro dipeptidase